jgi:RNA polymerase sigma-70 factor (ECF subfamily)
MCKADITLTVRQKGPEWVEKERPMSDSHPRAARPIHSDSGTPTSPEEFPSTIWMVIEKARDSGPAQSREAMEQLCQSYWQPVYAFIRRKGNDPDRSADLTQDFFALLLEPGALAAVTERKGKFRSFLIAACTHFLSNRRVYERTLKRGGGRPLLSMDQLDAEDRLHHEPSHEITPERVFLRRWATSMLDRVMVQLQTEADAKGRSRLFNQIRPALLGSGLALRYAQISADLGIDELTVKVAVHRYRARYRLLLRKEVARTVDNPTQIEEEISTLIEALA